MRILIIEDEVRLSNIIKKGFTEDGFAVDQAFDGEEGLYLATSESYDCIILDIMLPKKDGLSICRELREKGIHTPILMLTAKDTVEDIASGLDSGADDYLAKPFSFIELRARLQALELDPAKHVVKRGSRKISLTPKEFSILELLLRHKGEVVTRTMIIEHIWDYNFDNMSNVVDVFIATLRKKIDNEEKVKLIHTTHGVGYKISER